MGELTDGEAYREASPSVDRAGERRRENDRMVCVSNKRNGGVYTGFLHNQKYRISLANFVVKKFSTFAIHKQTRRSFVNDPAG